MKLSLENFLNARKAAEEKDHGMKNKVMSMKDAISKYVKDNSVIALSGANFQRLAMAAVREIIRQNIGNLTVVKTFCAFDCELLFLANLVKKIITGWASIGVPWGVSKVFRQRVEKDGVEYEEWSNFGINLRFKAAAMGVPFLPTFTMIGSDLIKINKAETIRCPYTGLELLAVPAIFPDVAILHVQRADKFGNAIIDGPTVADEYIARSSKYLILTVEEIVDTEEIRKEADKTKIPFFLVDAVVYAPFGAHPLDCYGYYDLDYEHIDKYVQAIEEKGLESGKEYLNEYVYSVRDHFEYLKKIPIDTLIRKMYLAKRIKIGEEVWEI